MRRSDISSIMGLALIFIIFMSISGTALADDSGSVTGTWESQYSFGPVTEVLTANIQQVGGNLVGSYSVKQSPSGDKYAGIVFGTASGNSVKVYYLSVRNTGGKDPVTSITFADGHMVDKDTFQGTYYYQNSDLLSLTGPYEAKRV